MRWRPKPVLITDEGQNHAALEAAEADGLPYDADQEGQQVAMKVIDFLTGIKTPPGPPLMSYMEDAVASNVGPFQYEMSKAICGASKEIKVGLGLGLGFEVLFRTSEEMKP